MHTVRPYIASNETSRHANTQNWNSVFGMSQFLVAYLAVPSQHCHECIMEMNEAAQLKQTITERKFDKKTSGIYV